MTKVTIDRELLERIDESAICDGMDATISDDLFTQLVAALAAPRQPEGDGLEVVAYRSIDATRGGGWMAHKHALPQSHIDQGALQEPLCRLSDAQRAIAELREECCGLRKERDSLLQQSVVDAGYLLTTIQQRDRLAGVLRGARHFCQRAPSVLPQIDAALAEVNK